ncbi:hypothetical protein F4604DRAFT_1677022 [Suillus subluteus]|nr:hypothetical protein F4604DRAFT_1677022 [Suillus subluteus]
MSTSGDDSTQDEDARPCYDFGWGTTTEPTSDADVEDDGPIYNLGWGTASMSREHPCVPAENEPNRVTATPGPQQDVIDLTDEDGPAYDFGWDTSTSGPDTMQQDPVVLSDEDDEPAYDLSWGRLQDTDRENVDLEHVNDRHVSPEVKSRTQSPTSSSSAMDLEGVNDRDASPEDVDASLANLLAKHEPILGFCRCVKLDNQCQEGHWQSSPPHRTSTLAVELHHDAIESLESEPRLH